MLANSFYSNFCEKKPSLISMKIKLPSASYFASGLITLAFGLSYECMSPADIHNLGKDRLNIESKSFEHSHSLEERDSNDLRHSPIGDN
ncbi:hypothetical protein [Leptospira sp. GIMC2001]|uniref:hypothetical protein n=1 Tax=Leptospira sp. GIMC2001 TaxID=1513297 RepID=UPI00234B67D9|nr:hypothetical protein [Leptospira sp. GIMC2001]WCL50426.1 hypothetical protein O4O04_06290 [Leptospira sp. GIMC2001]